ncbi:hypothetical protein PMI12_02014 [Variovorax sp. CF313]|uniref:hypothetical protein n=1 Tax=Variovorax sp. CF313 TaxID=1144315 RepID=UPI00027127AB|nr:hypothetical protein [Variovorax sp. CF313]EJL76870.1 hypothetical protein PMI12_02014 [Variovorax sp. CF313]
MTTRPSPPRNALPACGVVGATLLALIALGHDGRRIAQLAVLAAPMVLWLAWPLRSTQTRRLRTLLVWLWAIGFALDGAVRAYLLDTYQAAPDSAMVLGAAANTNAREGTEYLWMHWRSEAGQRPFRADWTAWVLADLLHIRWNGQIPTRNVLSDAYRWQAPEMPVAIESFSR